MTNLEQDWDIPRFAVMGNQNSEMLVVWEKPVRLNGFPERPGIYPMLRTSAQLHQEMQGYVEYPQRIQIHPYIQHRNK